MSYTLHTAQAVGAIAKAGVNVNSAMTWATSQTLLELWSDEIEAICCDVSRYDLITNYAAILTANGKKILSTICDAYVAQNIINYEPEAIGITGATLRLNFLQNLLSQNLSKIDDGKIKKYLAIPS